MVSTALYTGLSGLRLHQSYIDVIGNNLANVSTAGYRGARATFSDILSFTQRAGAGPNGSFGGTNPIQIGHGAVMATVDIDTNQGTFLDTGRPLDIALQGRGFFTLTDGLQRFYTRVGTFGLDNESNLVDLRTGLRVMSSTGGNIRIPSSGTLAAQPTQNVSFQGNLPARVGGPLTEILESASPLQAGVAAQKIGTAGGASSPQFDLSSFVNSTVQVRVNGGSAQTLTIDSATFGAGPVNAQAVADFFNNNLTGVEATFDNALGTVTFDTVALGDDASLKFDNGPGSTGVLDALGITATQANGSQSAALTTTDIAQLASRSTPYTAGDQITISGTNPDGSPFSDTFLYGSGAGNNGTTIQDLMDFINGRLDPAQGQVELDATTGTLSYNATNPGEAEMSLFIGDASGNTGGNTWPAFQLTQDGTGPDTAVTSIEVIDSQGLSHSVTMTFTRNANDTTIWDMSAEMDPSEGSILQNAISQIRFNDDGSFNVIGGGTNALQFQFNGISASQSVQINLGTSGQFDGIAMLGDTPTVAAVDQDGFGPGELIDAGFDPNGNLVAYYTNGQSQTLESLRISMFSNEAGLMRVGDTLWTESPNSDDAIFTTANVAGAGTVRTGSLENSNVDIAREFVSLIEAQRGFQANSRVITTTDEILAELINIVR